MPDIISDDDDYGLMPEEAVYTVVADNALQSFVEIIRECQAVETDLLIRKKHPRLYMKYPDYRLRLGFGAPHPGGSWWLSVHGRSGF